MDGDLTPLQEPRDWGRERVSDPILAVECLGKSKGQKERNKVSPATEQLFGPKAGNYRTERKLGCLL